jgi:hypothetical protein
MKEMVVILVFFFLIVVVYAFFGARIIGDVEGQDNVI